VLIVPPEVAQLLESLEQEGHHIAPWPMDQANDILMSGWLVTGNDWTAKIRLVEDHWVVILTDEEGTSAASAQAFQEMLDGGWLDETA
tara:strand:- start:1498 stop:1761 length:264 start_codon:yes stop_codon:yes gene_type:complete